MDNFNYAYTKTGMNEGGYSKVAGDNGGETFCGISRVNFPDWEGWKVLDGIPNKNKNEMFPVLNTAVKDFYRVNFWDHYRLGEIQNMQLACNMYDMCVNSGSAGVKLLQRTLQQIVDTQPAIKDDGIIGPITIAVANNQLNKDPYYVNAVYNCFRFHFYMDLALNNDNDKQFLKGWIRRLAEYI